MEFDPSKNRPSDIELELRSSIDDVISGTELTRHNDITNNLPTTSPNYMSIPTDSYNMSSSFYSKRTEFSSYNKTSSIQMTTNNGERSLIMESTFEVIKYTKKIVQKLKDYTNNNFDYILDI